MIYFHLWAAILLYVPCGRSEMYPEQGDHSLSAEGRNAEIRAKSAVHYRRVMKHTQRGLVQALCKHGHVYSEVVRNAMLRVDRKNYFNKDVADPYRIKSRQIGFGADISSPHIHAQMLELLKDKIKPGARILDIGSGSGYLTACLAYMAGPTGRVFGVEHVMELAESSIKNIDKGNSELLDQGRVQFVVWNGKHGYEREAPYDVIHVAPSYFTIPQKLLDQLVPGGRMLMPVGEPFKGQNLTLIDKLPDGYTIVTTVVRRVRTNPLYRDRYQQKKYYTEMKRKAAERYNTSAMLAENLTMSPFARENTYVFQTQNGEGHPHRELINSGISEGEPHERQQEREKGQLGQNENRDNEKQTLTTPIYAVTTSKPIVYPNHNDESSDYEFKSTTQWRWRQYYTHRTDNWIDYDEGFNPENRYNIDGVDHGVKLDHTEGGDYIYPDYRNMTFYPKHAEVWGNCEQYYKWYNANYVGQSSTPYNPVYTGELKYLPTIKPLPPGLLQDMARDSFPDHLFPISDYFSNNTSG